MACTALFPCLVPVGGCAYGPEGARICCGDLSGIVYIVELMGSDRAPALRQLS